MSGRTTSSEFRRVLTGELRHIASRPSLAFMLGPMPLLIFFILAAVFAPGVPRNLPVAVVDLDRSALSRQVVRMVDATSDAAVTREMSSLGEARQALVARDVYAILMIPSGMERDMFLQLSPEIVIFSNSQFLSSGGIAARSMGAAVSTFAVGSSVTFLEANGVGPDRAMELIIPIPVQQSPLFNPSLDYIQFLLSAIIPTVMQIFICAAAVLAFSRAKVAPDGKSNIVPQSGSILRGIAGRILPYTVLGTLVLLLGDVLLFTYFGADFRGSVPVFFFNGLLFILACQMLGALIATVATSTTGALGVMAVIVTPAFGFAGVSFPRFGMSDFAQAWGAIIPLTPYLELRTDQTLRGTPLSYSAPSMVWLFMLLVVYAALVWITLRWRARVKVVAQGADK